MFDGYFQYFTGFNLFCYSLQGVRVFYFFGNELILGFYLTRLFFFLFAFFVVRSNKHPLEVYFISILFLLIDILIFLAVEAPRLYIKIYQLFLLFFLFRIINGYEPEFLLFLCV